MELCVHKCWHSQEVLKSKVDTTRCFICDVWKTTEILSLFTFCCCYWLFCSVFCSDQHLFALCFVDNTDGWKQNKTKTEFIANNTPWNKTRFRQNEIFTSSFKTGFYFTLVDTRLTVIINSVEGEVFVDNLHFFCFTWVWNARCLWLASYNRLLDFQMHSESHLQCLFWQEMQNDILSGLTSSDADITHLEAFSLPRIQPWSFYPLIPELVLEAVLLL